MCVCVGGVGVCLCVGVGGWGVCVCVGGVGCVEGYLAL